MKPIQESRKKYEETRDELIKHHREYGKGWTGVIFGDMRYDEEGVRKFFEHLKGKGFRLQTKEDDFSSFVRETYSYSMKARYVIIIEIKRLSDGRFRVFFWDAVYFKKKSSKTPFFTGEEGKFYRRSL